MRDFHVEIGQTSSFSKTVSESDVYLFAGITGDFAPNHLNQAFMEDSKFQGRIAHGALIVGYMSAASTKILESSRQSSEVPVSLGYDRIRFVAPVFFGDTITVNYRVIAIDEERNRSSADITVTNQRGIVVAVAKHLLKWVPNQ